jgi:hypothetical protein
MEQVARNLLDVGDGFLQGKRLWGANNSIRRSSGTLFPRRWGPYSRPKAVPMMQTCASSGCFGAKSMETILRGFRDWALVPAVTTVLANPKADLTSIGDLGGLMALVPDLPTANAKERKIRRPGDQCKRALLPARASSGRHRRSHCR